MDFATPTPASRNINSIIHYCMGIQKTIDMENFYVLGKQALC
jgi:hypothetical protein